MGKDLYKELGVPNEATPEQIKKAYRKKMVNIHPDKNGGACSEDFHDCQLAYEVLYDPDSRAYYDRTGKVPKESKDKMEAEILFSEILFKAVVETPNDITLTIDVVGLAVDILKEHREEHLEELHRVKEFHRRSEVVRERMSSKDERNVTDRFIETQIHNMEEHCSKVETVIDLHTRAIEYAQNYSYEYKDSGLDPNSERVSFTVPSYIH